jgi:predicted TIM-barrel fold metal-dependent hydrolase
VDTHVHVFDSRYPLAPVRGYTPPDSNADDLRRLHETIGVDRVVLTQPSVYGTDNRAILDAADVFNAETTDRARAVVALGLDVGDDELEALDRRGVRGIRLNTDNEGGMPIEWSDVPRLCDRIRPLGWHLEFLFPGADLVDLVPVFEAVTVPMALAHFAYQPAAAGTGADGFRALLDLVRSGNTWLKISGADRVSAVGPPRYDDVAPLATAVLDTAPDRVMWGTDWPHPNKFERTPDDGDLVDTLGGWVDGDTELMRKMMVDTPSAFYGF